MDLIVVVPFNDLGAVERALAEHRGRVAGMILEPVMMNAGIIQPDDGYLAGLRDLLHARAPARLRRGQDRLHHGPGGVTGRYGVTPDLICLAKALGGGIAVAAIGGTDEVMALIGDGRYEQVGTFNGNPLAMAAARANLTDVLDDGGVRPPRRARASASGRASRASSPTRGCPGTSSASGAKGCVAFRRSRSATTATS